MNKLGITVAVFLAIASSQATAATIVMDFEDLAFDWDAVLYYEDAPYSGSDYHLRVPFDFGPNEWGVWGTKSAKYAGSTGVWINGNHTAIINRYDEQAFTLESIDLAFQNYSVEGFSATVTFYADNGDGSCGGALAINLTCHTDQQTVTLYGDGIHDFETIQLDSGFENVVRVWWTDYVPQPVSGGGQYTQFDNIVLSVAAESILMPAIDVQPNDANNFVKTDGSFSDKMFVAIQGSAEFDATQVDSATVKFGPAAVSPHIIPGVINDRNEDEFDDMDLTFRIADTGLGCDLVDKAITLTGETNGGLIQFEGSDVVTTSECVATSCHP